MNRIRFLVTLILGFGYTNAVAQFAPGIEWNQCIPDASVKSLVKVSDSLLTLTYELNSCSDSSAIGIRQYHINGDLQWEKIFFPPASASFHIFSLQKISSGYVLTGSQVQNDSSFNYIFKTDSIGTIVWEKKFFFDTTAAPVAGKTIVLSDGNLLFTGAVYTMKLSEVQVIKLNSQGDVIWQKTFGGSLNEYGKDVVVASNGNYIVGATTNSIDLDVSGNHGAGDIWMLMLDTTGILQWQKTFGGLYYDDAKSITVAGNGFIVAGSCQSDDGDLNDHHGSITYFDFVAFKMDNNGTILWKHSYGGSLNDFASQIISLADGNYLMTGNSYSINSDINDHRGTSSFNDQWTIKISSGGTLIWKKSTGGTKDDWSNCVLAMDSDNFIIAGGSISKDVDHQEACFSNSCHVINGGWVVKLNEHCPQYPAAAFSYSQNEKQFSFSNQSYNATNYSWDFGDGASSNSAEPTHTYLYNGVYNVCLTASDNCSGKTTCTSVITCPAPSAAFSFNFTGSQVQFNNLTVNSTSYNWDFGDGNFSSEENPLHAYTANGSYAVELTVTDSCNQQSNIIDTINTCDGFQGEFTYESVGNIFSFADLTIGLPDTWLWDFGDGNASSEKNPLHQYNSGGTFNVCLTVLSAGCLQQMVCKSIQVCEPVTLDLFSFSKMNNSVSFFDSSSLASSYYWDFGDGNISTDQNPIHYYSQSGTYSVCEVVSSNCNSDTICSSVVFECLSVVSNFNYITDQYDVSFTDQSENALSWYWNFGDGNFSTEQNPTHQFGSSGNYNVCLTSYNSCSNDTICLSVHIDCTPLNTAFTYNTTDLTSDFSSLASNASSWQWDFGDGNFSTEENPSHTYSLSGDYIVCLVAFNFCNSDTFCESIHVNCPVFTAAFNFVQSNDTAFFNSTSPTASQWYWDFGDGNFSAEENPSHVYSIGATYYVCLISGDGCSTDTLCDSVQVYGVYYETLEAIKFDVAVFPDPAASFATVQFTLAEESNVKVDLCSVEGKKEIAIADNIFSKGLHELKFKCDFLPSGIYFLQIRNDSDRMGAMVVKKLVKE